MKYNKIILLGMMGCGKSTVSKLLSAEINEKYYDLDSIFETKNNIKIKDYFKYFGESAFRKEETELLKEILSKESYILSPGGGIILSEFNRDIIFQNEILTIYLKTNAETIFNRIKNDTTRPLLLVENPKKEIEKLINERERYYAKAKLIIETDCLNINEITRIIKNECN